ncbi:lysosome-associated membrane glycoprotein 2 isoform X1 [Acanthopagrus latus]|uniref:lysosome-associated membrane glycoprotein 2 isoform X1 n=1 Tax=Acanthopagrus latus TaxID=8177 RepID=UPI00187BF410|nr:lysosome-associated membrane glycoprotein 2 isoform X1 [Acanthopagrus latus]
MYRRAAFVLFLACGIVFQLSHGVEVEVKDQDKLCLYANLMVNFSVSYDIAGNKSATAEFELPANVTTVGSECNDKSSLLKLNFGEGHSWSMNFTVTDKMYQVDSIAFTYNLSDTTLFPNSLNNDTKTSTVKPHITDIGLDTCYSCKSNDMLEDVSVNQTLFDVLIQAFVNNGSKSEQITSCAADVPTASPTTAAPATTTKPTTTPTTTPTPTLPPPATGNYSLKNDNGSTVCLLAYFGLRISLKQGDKYEEMNFEPNGTTVSGSCGVNSSELVLLSSTMNFSFTFLNDAKKFRLHALNVTGKTSSGVPFTEANSSLSLWEASVGSSYMCNKEQNNTITGLLSIYTFDLHVQPFGVKKDSFSTAEECQADADSFLVPIAVGVALLVLIVIVLLAYFIGRKRNMAAGYESF